MMSVTSENVDPVDAMFNDLVSEALQILLPSTVVITWIWVAWVALFDPVRTNYGYLALAFILITGVTSFQIHAQKLRLAIGLYLIGLTAVVTTIVLAYQTSNALYLYLQVILAVAVLTNPRIMWLATLFTIGLALTIGVTRQIPSTTLLLPLLMLVVTALTTWLSSLRLFTALDWALNMSVHARKSADEARNHRAELQRVLQSLDSAYARLERTNQTLIFTQEAAEKAYRFKSDFVANVSHELRTPLNLIVGFSEMMATAPESYGGVPLPREYRGDVMATYRSARHLFDLINDVLDLSQIEAGRMAIVKTRVELGDVVREAAEMVRGLAEARGLKLILDLPEQGVLLGLDRIRIRQVLLNLLTNAMRYTNVGWVRARIAVHETEAMITVADSGRGIAPDKLHRAFEAFDRLDEEQLQAGNGLGLAVSKKFVELHEGKMWIESEVGRGTEVSFSLPLPTNAEKMPLSRLKLSNPLPYSGQAPLVLVLHDDPRALTLLRRHINQCEFLLAETAEEASAIMQATLPQAILIDANWSHHQNALAANEWLTGLPLAAHIPTITFPLPSVHHLGVLMGATDYLPKPVTRDDVALALARLPKRPHTVLVVDDEPNIVRLIGRMLKAIDANLRILEAFGGEEGLAVLRAHQPDAVFLDLVMPKVSGYNLIQEVAKDHTLAQTAVIVVSVRSIEQETAPILGELRLQRAAGFSLTQLLRVLQALLTTIAQPDGGSPTNAAAQLAVYPG